MALGGNASWANPTKPAQAEAWACLIWPQQVASCHLDPSLYQSLAWFSKMIEYVKAQLECAKKSCRYYSDQLDKKIGHKNCLAMAYLSVLLGLIIAFTVYLAYTTPPCDPAKDLSCKPKNFSPFEWLPMFWQKSTTTAPLTMMISTIDFQWCFICNELKYVILEWWYSSFSIKASTI